MARLEWEMTDRILKEERLFKPSEEIVNQANITQYMRKKGFNSWEDMYLWSIANPEAFWEEMARELVWFKPWSQVMEWNYPYVKYFLGARCNIVYNALDRHIETPTKNKIAFYWEGENGETRSLTYLELYKEVNKVATALKKAGIRKGDRVCIYLPRILEQIISMLAVARIGAVHTVVYSGFSSVALQERIADAEAKMVIACDGYYYHGKVIDSKSKVDEALKENRSVEKVVIVKRIGKVSSFVEGRDVWWDDFIKEGSDYQPCEEMDSEDVLYTLYTSGTTGKPKGVIHVHGGYMVGIYATQKFIFDIKNSDVYWCTADPGWVTGHSYIVYGPLITGTTSIIYEGAPDFPDPGRWWSIVEKYRVTILYTTPTAIRGLMRFGEEWPGKYTLSSLRLLGTVGEPINPESWIWFRKVTGNRLPIMDTWWQTETGMILITPLPITDLKPGSATKPFLGIEAAVMDKEGNLVPPGHGGYLVIKKPWPALMRTIYKDPQRYETYWNTIPNVYFAGDAANIDEDGYFWVQGRIDDVIKKSGYRLGSMEIESALVSHPAVAEAAVIGKPDPLKGEMIKAFIILKEGYDGSQQLRDELRLHVRQTVGPIATPDEIEFVSSLPKTRSGKIMRRVLRAKDLGLPIGDLSTLEE